MRRDRIKRPFNLRLSDEAREALAFVAEQQHGGNMSAAIEALALEKAALLREWMDRTPVVTSWSPVRLAEPTTCADCERDLAAGVEAFLERLNDGNSGAVICRSCVED